LYEWPIHPVATVNATALGRKIVFSALEKVAATPFGTASE
jgi:hypothetical protein